MNWLKNFVRPKIRGFLGQKRDVPENMWIKDPATGKMVFYKDVQANLWVMPESGHHLRMPAQERLQYMFDGGEYDEIELPEVADDPLKFADQKRYTDRLKAARKKTGRNDAMLAGIGKLQGVRTVMAVQDFEFMGGSMGMAVGEAIITAINHAIARHAPFVLFTASGGARMQEGILSLMQMPRTTIAINELKEAGLPYVVVLTHPTTGGVTASYAMLGDVHIAEPGALIGFAGPRVIEQTIREKLPEGFQRAEYLLEHGMVDIVSPRGEHREVIGRLLRLFMGLEPHETAATEAAAADGEAGPAEEQPPVEQAAQAEQATQAEQTEAAEGNGADTTAQPEQPAADQPANAQAADNVKKSGE